MNYLSIGRSVICMLSSDSVRDVEHIDNNLGSIVRAGHGELVVALKILTESIATSTEIDNTERLELLDKLDLISTQAALPPEKRKSEFMKPVLFSLVDRLNAVDPLARLWASTEQSICRHFGIKTIES